MLLEELLVAICECLTESPVLAQIRLKHYAHASPELLSLSCVDQRLRRICLPFVFSYLECKSLAELKRLRHVDSCILKCIRTLNLDAIACFSFPSGTCAVLAQILPSLTSLLCMDLREIPLDAKLVVAINSHPTVATVAVSGCPEDHFDYPEPSPFSKLFLAMKQVWARLPSDMMEDFDHGLRLQRLQIRPVVDRRLADSLFTDLCELVFTMNSLDGLSWLPQFIHRHSKITKITFQDDSRTSLMSHLLIPFCSEFVEECKRLSLSDAFVGHELTIVRSAIHSSNNWNQWNTSTLDIRILSSFMNVLHLARDSFPLLTTLTILICGPKEMVHIDLFLHDIANFSALKILRLFRTLHRLHLDEDRPIHPGRRVKTSNVSLALSVEPAVLFYAQYLAAKLPTLEAVYIEEVGSDGPERNGN
ncbi:hypothetical protein C8J56DRAFT_283254, partial [Mycena floridula]